ncbi:MAG: GAF domain-containing protein [Thermodesulfobacteriota bacterium]
MADIKKNVAIIGANKEALKLLPVLLNDRSTRVCMIADSNRDAMIFKLNELGYRLSKKLKISTTFDLNEIKNNPDIDIIIDAVQDRATEKFLEAPEFNDIEKLGPLSARLIWEVRNSAAVKGGGRARESEQAALFSSLREIVNSLRLITDRKELFSLLLKLITESTGAERSSIMLTSPGEKKLRVEIAKGMDEEVVRKIRVPFGEGISGKAAAEGKPIIVSGKADPVDFVNPRDRSDARCAMSVPLIAGREVIGVINVSTGESTDAYKEEDLKFLVSLASLAAEVVKKSNEYDRLRSDAAKFGFWKEIDGIMSSDMPMEKRLSVIARMVVEEVPGLTCYIYLFNEESKRLLLKASSSRDAAGLGMLGIRAGEGIEGYAMESKKDVVLVDRTEDDVEKKVYISMPMVCQSKFVGTLSGQVISTQGLSKYHESFLKDIRTLVGQSVYRFMETERDSRWKKRFSSVDDLGLELIPVTDPKRLVDMIAEKSAAVLGADGSVLRVMHDDTQRYQTVASTGIDGKDIKAQFQPLEKETVLEVLRKKEPITREFSEQLSPFIKSVISHPLKIDGKIIGVISLFNKRYEGSVSPSAFTQADLEILRRFAVFAERTLASTLFSGVVIKEPEEKDISGLTPLEAFEKKVEQELNRSRRLDKGLVLATVRMAGLRDVAGKKKADVEARLMDLMKEKIRSFDFVTRLNDEMFGLLFPDTDEKVTRVLESIMEAVNGDDLLAGVFAEGKIDLYYGYAAFPGDADSFTSLFSKASRRDMVKMDKSLDGKIK